MKKRKTGEITNLELLKSEAFTGSDLHVVLESLTVDNRAERPRGGTGEDLNSLLLPRCVNKHKVQIKYRNYSINK